MMISQQEIYSLLFSEHLSQFISVKKECIEYKHYNIYARDYSKFTTENFKDDVSLQNFANKFDSAHDQFNDFFWKPEGCVDRHAPIKNLTGK